MSRIFMAGFKTRNEPGQDRVEARQGSVRHLAFFPTEEEQQHQSGVAGNNPCGGCSADPIAANLAGK